MARVFKVLIAISVLTIGTLLTVVFALSQPLPKGETGPAAEDLTQRIQAATSLDAWGQTGAVKWTFSGANKHLWDRSRNLDEVQWSNHRVLVNLNTQQGIAYTDGQEVRGEEAQALIERAYAHWINDSFWLNPIAKFHDDGVERRRVEWDGKEGLMITYSSGGLTPGDSYLWIPNEQGLPTGWRMWVSIIPLKGIYNSWSGWQTLSTGAKVSTSHRFDYFDLELTLDDVAGTKTLAELVENHDPFSPLFDGANSQ